MTTKYDLTTACPYAGQTLKIKSNSKDINGYPYTVEDWWTRVGGRSWMNSGSNPAAMIYAVRSADADLPFDDYVVYGKIDNAGHLIHISELELPNVNVDS